MSEEQSASDDGPTLRVEIRPFDHFFGPKRSKPLVFPDGVNEELIIRHVGPCDDSDFEVDENTDCQFTYLPI